MQPVIFNSRPVEIEEVSCASDYSDSYIAKAYYIDTETELSDSELDQLTNELDLYEFWFERQVDQANFYQFH